MKPTVSIEILLEDWQKAKAEEPNLRLFEWCRTHFDDYGYATAGGFYTVMARKLGLHVRAAATPQEVVRPQAVSLSVTFLENLLRKIENFDQATPQQRQEILHFSKIALLDLVETKKIERMRNHG